MPYVDLAGLSRYASRQKDRLERDCALLRDMQWLRTEKAGVVSCWPVGGTPLEPTVDFLFSETPPASGDKGPDNPSAIAGVSSIFFRRTGVNFISVPYRQFADAQSNTYNSSGVTFTLNNDNSIIVNGTATANAYFALIGRTNENVYMPAGKYTVKQTGNAGIALIFYSADGTININTVETSKTFILDSATTGRFYYRIQSGTTLNNFILYPQVFYGDNTDEVFSIGQDVSATLPLGSTYYGGTLDVASGVMTVTWHGLDLGTVSMRYSSTYEVFATANIPAYVNTGEQDCSCETFTYNSSALLSLPDGTFKYQGGNFNFKASQYNGDVSAFQSAHSGEVLVYKLATPYTVQLDSVSISALVQADKYAPRLNTLYTDASAVQVGYVKSPIRDEYELQQAVIAQGGNV